MQTQFISTNDILLVSPLLSLQKKQKLFLPDAVCVPLFHSHVFHHLQAVESPLLSLNIGLGRVVQLSPDARAARRAAIVHLGQQRGPADAAV